LLGQRRFAPFFWTLFSGAANDNLFKFAFTVMLTYQLSVSWLPPAMAGLAIGALFILPFVLFSATSGQLCDKYDKARMMRRVKSLEVLIMLLATAGLLASGQWLAWQVPLLLACIFLMGLHSTLFGPVKFAYLPQALRESELMGGNGMVEMGTFVAILLGNVAGGLLVAWPGDGPAYVAAACLALALAGRLAAQFIPEAPANDPALTINWNPWSETWRNLRHAKGDPKVFLALIGISWMWFFGAVFLSQFPAFAKEILHGNAQVASLLLVVFSVGIAIGSLLCEVLGRRQVELGLVPLGAMGMTLFTVDLYFAARGLPLAELMDAAAFLQHAANWRVMAPVRADPIAHRGIAPRPHHCGQQHSQRAVHDRQRAAGRRLADSGAGHGAGVLVRGSWQRAGDAVPVCPGARLWQAHEGPAVALDSAVLIQRDAAKSWRAPIVVK
jgi:MFS family permease